MEVLTLMLYYNVMIIQHLTVLLPNITTFISCVLLHYTDK